MRRRTTLGTSLIAALFAGSVAAIAFHTREAGTPIVPAGPTPVADVEAVAPPAAVTSTVRPAPSAAPPPAVAPALASPPRAVEPERAREGPRIVRRPSREHTRRSPGRVLARSVRRELDDGAGDLRASLARCATSDEPRRRPAVLMLELEMLDGHVRIVDAPVHTRGDASDALVGCAQGALRNRVVRAAAARPGDHGWMPFALALHRTMDGTETTDGEEAP